MDSVLDLLENYFLGVEVPKTGEEVAGDLSLPLAELEPNLTDLLSKGKIVTREVKIEEDHVKLYWKSNDSPASSSRKRHQPSSNIHLSGIRPPSKKSRLPFKSPVRTAAASYSATPTTTPLSSRSRSGFSRRSTSLGDVQRLTDDALKLKVTLQAVEKEMQSLVADSYCEEELQKHIDKLHEYNEIKDAGQLLFGKIAEVEGTTTAALYERFGLEIDD